MQLLNTRCLSSDSSGVVLRCEAIRTELWAISLKQDVRGTPNVEIGHLSQFLPC